SDRVLAYRLTADPASDARMDEFFAQAGLKPRDRVVVLNPGAGRADKRWPLERFRALAVRLAGAAYAHVIVVWGPGEERDGRAIVSGGGARVLLAPPTDLRALIALLRRARGVVAAATGPLHLAAPPGMAVDGLSGPNS